MVRFWGVRGSIPTPGPSTAKYGGNTPCVEVQCGDERIIFDVGTGIRALGDTYGAPMSASIFVSHYHYDHLQGLPFFTPMFHPDTKVVFYGPTRGSRTVKDVIIAQMQQPFFPVTAEMVFRAQVDYRAMHEGDHIQLGDAVVTALEVKHPGGNLAYRVHYRGRSLVYATDTEHGTERDEALVNFARGADLLIYDSMYSEDEYRGVDGPPKIGWGHSTWEQALALADKARVGKLCLFHHDPSRDDAALDKLVARIRKKRKATFAAAEGQIVHV